jgi:hypothetical protein
MFAELSPEPTDPCAHLAPVAFVVNVFRNEAQDIPDIPEGFGDESTTALRLSTLRFMNALLNCRPALKHRYLSEVAQFVLGRTFSRDPELCAMALYGAEMIASQFWPWFQHWFYEEGGACQLVNLVKDRRLRERALGVFWQVVADDHGIGGTYREEVAEYVASLDLFEGLDVDELTDGEKTTFCALWRSFVKCAKSVTRQNEIAAFVQFLGDGVFSLKMTAVRAVLTYLKVLTDEEKIHLIELFPELLMHVAMLLPAISVQHGDSNDFVRWADLLTCLIRTYDRVGSGEEARKRVREEDFEDLIDQYCESTDIHARMRAKELRSLFLNGQEDDSD